ncbi:hypothetical protein [Lutibacter sp.]|uniref:hypothetical protein n=1 Tax=Lutibacter sp. TaxID=1925666 RepID=UPI0035616E96
MNTQTQIALEQVFTADFLNNKKFIITVLNSIKRMPFGMKFREIELYSERQVVQFYVDLESNKEQLSKIILNLELFIQFSEENFKPEPCLDESETKLDLGCLLFINRKIHKNFVCFDPDVQCFYNGNDEE